MKSNMKCVLKNVDMKYTESYQFSSQPGIDPLGSNIPRKWPTSRTRRKRFSLGPPLLTLKAFLAKSF